MKALSIVNSLSASVINAMLPAGWLAVARAGVHVRVLQQAHRGA